MVSTSRADYGHLYWVLRELQQRPDIHLSILPMAAHMAPRFGRTVKEFSADGFDVEQPLECLLDSDTDLGMAKTIGLGMLGMAERLAALRPDLLLLIADRYEMLAPAAAALALRIPIAHIEGGEISEGAIDDAVRNALTKMSHLHFVSTELARRRVLAMGEEAWRVTRAGAPSLDHFERSRLPQGKKLEAALGRSLPESPWLVSIHPTTLDSDPTADARALFSALDGYADSIIISFPNADAGYQEIIELATDFCRRHARASLHVNLGIFNYLGLLKQAALMVGNSSSGIMESPTLAMPCVNVGMRQQGRERAPNIIDVPGQVEAIRAAIEQARKPSFRDSLAGMTNPYGDGHASQRIAQALSDCPLVVLQLDKLGFSVPVALRCEAPCAGNGRRPFQARERRSGAPQERPKGWPVSVHGGVPALVKGYGHSLRAAPCPER